MPELLEEQETPQFDYEQYLDIVRRRHLYFLVPLLVGWLVVWGASWVLPSSYKSSTLVEVQQPTMPESYVPSNVTDNLQDRLQTITQQILSRTRLLTIIQKLNLYNGADAPKNDDDKVAALRKNINVETAKDGRNNQITSFTISFTASDPRMAQKVTSELTQLFIDENTKVREEQSQATTHFMEQQLEDARVALAAQEAKVKQFEAIHEGALPTQQSSNLQILSGLQGQLQNQQDALNTAKQQRVYYQTLIEQYKSLHASGRSVDGGPTELTAINQQLEHLRGELTDLRSRYTDSYPDVLKLKAQIAQVEQQKRELMATPTTPGAKQQAGEVESGPLLQLQGQLQSNQIEIQSREKAISSLEARINEYQGRLNAQPGTEQQLLELTRGYEQTKSIYDDLLKKKTQSAMATSMEQLQRGERFIMLDPPSLPVKPDFPNHLKFCGFGLAAGLVLGGLIVFLLEFLDDRMHSESDIRALLAMNVLAEVPEVQSEADKDAAKRRLVLGWAFTAFVGICIAAGSTFSFLRG
ncbi:XrtA system polysaccharide chain length determinant [Occallatibacter savannae]|uniref:XrtA system polysaccharide chain length determinant n=1 Tax=Occallatibacter savannae TaxID=1002691 RepID=UPI000D68A8C4|nr:XrtA system polysaccharide chain length determinant [Occallatibacter savannae]